LNTNEDNSDNTVDITDNLDEFENVFFDRKPEEVEVEDTDEDEEDADLGEDETDPPAPDDDEDASEEDEDEDEPEEEEKPEPKGKKNRQSAQERINELTAKARAGERREQALLKRLEEIEAAVKKEVKQEEPKSIRELLSADAPNPDAKDDKGEPLYELGEFDPKFIRDLTKFTIAQETKLAKEEAAKEAQEEALRASRDAIQAQWADKLEKAEVELPDIREKITDLVDVFQELEPAYGEYIASAIMASEFGPEIMYYFSQNIGEAQDIVASGPSAATRALGRLEAKFEKPTKQEEKRNITKVSKAVEPPEGRTRGNQGKFAVNPDTDDLDAFEREYFKRPKY
jgi:hypothetical protein